MKAKKSTLVYVIAIVVLFGVFSYVYAFIGPSQNPPGGNGILVASSTRALGIATTTVYSTESQLLFKTLGGSNQHIIFSPNGYVGIATTTPSEMLYVFGNIGVSGNVEASGSFVGSLSGSLSAANVSSEVFGRLQGEGNFAFPASLGVATSSEDGLPQSLSVYGGGYFSGDVGIGTVSPSEKLEVVGNILLGEATTNNIIEFQRQNYGISKANEIQFDSGDGLQSTIRWERDNTNLGVIGRANLYLIADADNSESASIIFQSHHSTFGGGTELMRIEDTGNVGIGTAGPSYKLEVIGDLRVSATSTFSGNWSLGGGAMTNLNMNSQNITAVNKISVTTIDPLYNIGGTKYATYVASIVGGVKEEYIGKGRLAVGDSGNSYVIDFNKVKKGSDLWVWYKTIDFSKENVDVLVTPYGQLANIYYVIEGNKLIFRGDKATEFSYRLIGKRFDWRAWPTLASDQSEWTNLIIK
ncbi:MAG TPA: hypothetical protein ENH86_00665 [Candidatus Jorgensenbacteria bacterium]|nr:hypothetical protein [Candidatus Jorgensenbacteria bacterium]